MNKTYMELVNEAIIECKVTLDPLDEFNFDAPPRTVMYNHFKRWINNAYEEILLQRVEWYFRHERASVELWPRLHIAELTYLPQVGDRLVGTLSGAVFTVVKVHDFEHNELDPSVSRTLSVEFDENFDTQNLDLRETFDRIYPTAEANVGYLQNLGRYNFRDDVYGLDCIDAESVRAYLNKDMLSNSGRNGTLLTSVPFHKWYGGTVGLPYIAQGSPMFITEAPDGNYEIYPQPQKNFFLNFDYTRDFVPMQTFDDIPVGVPEKYQNILIWKAVQEYADFDNNANIFSRAKKKLDHFDYWLHRDEMPTPRMGICRF